MDKLAVNECTKSALFFACFLSSHHAAACISFNSKFDAFLEAKTLDVEFRERGNAISRADSGNRLNLKCLC